MKELKNFMRADLTFILQIKLKNMPIKSKLSGAITKTKGDTKGDSLKNTGNRTKVYTL